METHNVNVLMSTQRANEYPTSLSSLHAGVGGLHLLAFAGCLYVLVVLPWCWCWLFGLLLALLVRGLVFAWCSGGCSLSSLHAGDGACASVGAGFGFRLVLRWLFGGGGLVLFRFLSCSRRRKCCNLLCFSSYVD